MDIGPAAVDMVARAAALVRLVGSRSGVELAGIAVGALVGIAGVGPVGSTLR